jgi:endonuclease/exonuclease/phosphatase family metal-dependent hydrolase
MIAVMVSLLALAGCRTESGDSALPKQERLMAIGETKATADSAQAPAAEPASASASSAQAPDSSVAGRALRILSFNVRTWTRDRDADSDVFWRTRMEAMERMIEDLDPDVLCFQEMLFPATRYVPGGYRRVGALNISHPIYVRKGLRARSSEIAIRWQACTVEGVRIINVHSSWDAEITQRTVEQVNAQLTSREPALACGDWNVRLATLQKVGLQMESARVLLGVPEDDTFANFKRPTESHGPIDHFFVRGLTPLSYRLITNPYGCTKMSDHYPQLLDVKK